MNNLLTGNVQIIDLPALPVVWYTPEGFPGVEACADLIDAQDDLLLIHNGWQYRLICKQQVTQIISGRALETSEALDVEHEEWRDAQAK